MGRRVACCWGVSGNLFFGVSLLLRGFMAVGESAINTAVYPLARSVMRTRIIVVRIRILKYRMMGFRILLFYVNIIIFQVSKISKDIPVLCVVISIDKNS